MFREWRRVFTLRQIYALSDHLDWDRFVFKCVLEEKMRAEIERIRESVRIQEQCLSDSNSGLGNCGSRRREVFRLKENARVLENARLIVENEVRSLWLQFPEDVAQGTRGVLGYLSDFDTDEEILHVNRDFNRRLRAAHGVERRRRRCIWRSRRNNRIRREMELFKVSSSDSE